MDLIEHTKVWVSGEVLHGKIMIAIGIGLVVAWIAIFRNEHPILKGMIIPLALMIVILIGYGGMQVLVRPGHVDKVSSIYSESPEKAMDQEQKKALKDDKAYSTLKPIWAALIIISVILYFIFSTHYLRGLSIGLVGLFLTLLILDTFLQYRLSFYLNAMNEIMN